MTAVDIVIPFWGEPHLLYETVESVRSQSVPEWRLVVLDDCYPDASVHEWFAALDDPRVTYVRNEQNLGITENFREAIRRAEADHLVILGCDDLLHPNYLELVTATIAAVPDADVVQPGVVVIDDAGTPVRPLVDRVKRGLLAPRELQRAHGAQGRAHGHQPHPRKLALLALADL